MDALKLTFLLEHETKGALRYSECGPDGQFISIMDGAKVGTLYLRKSAVAPDVPKKISVTIQSI